jgi:diguanylate cyclase (GGDEF)-like protein
MGEESLASRRRGWLPHRWRLWSLPGRALAYVLAVDLLAAAAVVLASILLPGTAGQWRTAGWLAVCALVHLHASQAIERIRRDHSHSPYVDLCSVWIFAGALVLPPLPELALIALIYADRWVMVNRFDAHRPPHRTVFTGSTLALSALAAMAVIHVTGLSGQLTAIGSGVRPGWPAMVAVALAISTQWTVNSSLVGGIILLTARLRKAREALGSGADNLLEFSQLILGTFVALALLWWPVAAALMVIPTLALHQCVLLHQLRLAARTDHRTGLLHAVAWQEQARVELDRVRQEGGRLAVLMIDLDWFKRINDTHGHLVGDDILLKVAGVLSKSVRRGDAVGRYGGEEFAILLPGVDEREAHTVAERIRSRIRALEVTDHGGQPVLLTATIGGAVWPDVDESSIEGLLRAADAALYAGKAAGRNRVALAG